MTSKRIIVLSVPPTMNTNALRDRHGFARHKKQWQNDLALYFLSVGLPQPIPADGPIRVDVSLRFSTKRIRDVENYRGLLSKALGDALDGGDPTVWPTGRWIPDDTHEYWRLSMSIEPELGAETTTIDISWDDRPELEEAA